MRKNLDKTDVVIVGMGAAGGVAALPLTNAGLNVIGIEAGGWLNPRDFAPDELRNGTRNWPQTVQKAASEAPTSDQDCCQIPTPHIALPHSSQASQ